MAIGKSALFVSVFATLLGSTAVYMLSSQPDLSQRIVRAATAQDFVRFEPRRGTVTIKEANDRPAVNPAAAAGDRLKMQLNFQQAISDR